MSTEDVDSIFNIYPLSIPSLSSALSFELKKLVASMLSLASKAISSAVKRKEDGSILHCFPAASLLNDKNNLI